MIIFSASVLLHSSSPMAASPEALPGRPPDFRAPPPSPVANAGSRRSGVVNDDELTEFLEQSTRVPDLVLPDLLFPRQISIQSMPQIDFRSLMSVDDDNSIDISNVIESAAAIGCFQIVNHGISQDSVGSVLAAATEIFRLSPENKAIASRSSGKLYGFEEFSGDEDASDGGDACEEFVWFRDDGLTSVMEGIWPNGYSNFSQRMEILSKAIEEVAIRVLQVLSGSNLSNSTNGIESVKGLHENVGSICCLYKHCRNINAANKWLSSLKSDILRMLIKGSDYSHALCVHLCDGASDFHVYSKKGWMSFCPEKDAIIVTIGDQLQAWSGGRYRNVIGRPIFKVEEESISLSFLISPATVGQTSQRNTEKTISVGQQAIFAIIFTLLGHLFIHIYQKF